MTLVTDEYSWASVVAGRKAAGAPTPAPEITVQNPVVEEGHEPAVQQEDDGKRVLPATFVGAYIHTI